MNETGRSSRRPPQMSVLIVPACAPARRGEIYAHIRDLAVQLVRRHRIDVVVACPAAGDATVSTAEQLFGGVDGVRLRRLPAARTAGGAPAGIGWAGHLERIAREENISLVNVHASESFAACRAARACRGVPFVLTYYGGPARDGGRFADIGRRSFQRTMLARTVRRADALILACGDTVDGLARTVVPIRESICPATDPESQARRTLNVFERVLHRRAHGTTRVAVVAPYYHPHIGGLENYAQQVVQALDHSPRHDVVVLCTNGSRRTVVESQGGITVVRLPTLVKLSNSPLHPWWPILLRRLFRRLSIDVVHAHAPVPGLADVATFVAGARPVVLTYHSGSLLKGRRWIDLLLSAYEKYWLPCVFNRCAALGAVSPVSKVYETGRAVLLPPGVDVTAFSPAPVGRRRDPTVLYVGRIDRSSWWKGLDILFQSMALLRSQVPDVRLNMVGDGDAVPVLRELARRLEIDDIVDWHGALDGSALVEEYRRAAVVVLPSTTECESFGMVLIEAMACGRPVVGSEVGGIPFVVRPEVEGLLVPPGEPKALADACRSILLDPALAEHLGGQGRRIAEDRWAWSKRIGPILDVLDQTLARGEERRVNA
ncbi:glycosyltransferase [Mycobacterium sp. 94-17]|uniref:glycosyltransferase n=1 Tax=Mycobacterium sp. 94-17 TaxID=2986147 RepID=UPI002D1F3923|nr:glycosyltransferase [Mycobacterium sp. 94-17]MEB4210080.1 glycosyltransferase [Mycobacterium sp. 94-17]